MVHPHTQIPFNFKLLNNRLVSFTAVLSAIQSESFISRFICMQPDLGKMWELSSKIIDNKYKRREAIQAQNVDNDV